MLPPSLVYRPLLSHTVYRYLCTPRGKVSDFFNVLLCTLYTGLPSMFSTIELMPTLEVALAMNDTGLLTTSSLLGEVTFRFEYTA